MSATHQLSNLPTVDLAAALEPETLHAWLSSQYAMHEARQAELLAAHKRFTTLTAAGITNDAMAGRATDFARQIKVEIAAMDETRSRIKAPVLAAQRTIDGSAKAITDPLVVAATDVTDRVTQYLRDKETKLRQEAAAEAARKEAEAQRLMDEAAENNTPEAVENAVAAMAESQAATAIAESSTASLTKMRTQLGGTSSLKDNWIYALEDITKVPATFLAVNDVMVKAAIKSGTRTIPGLKIVNQPKATIR